MCETVGDFYDYLHEIIEKHEKDYNIEDGNLSKMSFNLIWIIICQSQHVCWIRCDKIIWKEGSHTQIFFIQFNQCWLQQSIQLLLVLLSFGQILLDGRNGRKLFVKKSKIFLYHKFENGTTSQNWLHLCMNASDGILLYTGIFFTVRQGKLRLGDFLSAKTLYSHLMLQVEGDRLQTVPRNPRQFVLLCRFFNILESSLIKLFQWTKNIIRILSNSILIDFLIQMELSRKSSFFQKKIDVIINKQLNLKFEYDWELDESDVRIWCHLVMVKGHVQVKLLLSFKCFCSLFIYYSKNISFATWRTLTFSSSFISLQLRGVQI